MKQPLPLWVDAFLADTAHLSAEEVGIYVSLLMHAWRHDTGTLPDDDRYLARVSRVTLHKWRKVRPVIVEFFTIIDERWHQKRLLHERERAEKRAQTARNNGARSRGPVQKYGGFVKNPCEGESIAPPPGKTPENSMKSTKPGTQRVTQTPAQGPTQNETTTDYILDTSESGGDSESSSESQSKRTRMVIASVRKRIDRGGYDEAFGRFWKACPRRTGKGAANTAYLRAAMRLAKAGDPEPDKTLMAGMKAFAAATAASKTEPRFICHPATWLNQDRWLDETGAPASEKIDRSALSAADRIYLMEHGEAALRLKWASANGPTAATAATTAAKSPRDGG